MRISAPSAFIFPARSGIHFLVALSILTALISGCKTRKQVADSYKYLIKEDNKTPVDSAVVAPPIKPMKILSSNASVNLALAEADHYLGTPYRHGGISTNGIDCSGLAHKSYLAAGITLPRSTGDQAKMGVEVKRSELEPGDLLFFSNDANKSIDHVGIVHTIEGPAVTFIHSSTSKGVRYDRLDEGYWKDRLITARRIAK